MKRKGKSIVSCLLVLALLLGMVPSMTPTAYAYAATHTHDGTNFKKWTTSTSLPTTQGDYYLTCDVTLSTPWFPPPRRNNEAVPQRL